MKVDTTTEARALLPFALLRSTFAVALVPVATYGLLLVLRVSLGANILPDLLVCAFVCTDLIERMARARHSLGELISVRDVQRVAEVEPVLAVLKAANIPAFARSFSFRSTLQFLGPYAPVEICVSHADEAAARSALGVPR